jgi:predicted 3-demethylubiquinone-9 3-methyltransferase (glyoxalase superfamily)
MAHTQRITSNLWFDNQAEEAAKFYTSIFKNSSIGRISRYTEAGKDIHKMPIGSVMTIEFVLDGQTFTGLNGGPVFKFNESISFIVNCETQDEVDYYWEKLNLGGDPNAQQCGWLKDKFGISWQIVPTKFVDMLTDPDAEKAIRVMNTMLSMKKLDLPVLEKAYNGD